MKAKLNHIQSGFSKWYLKNVAPLDWKFVLAKPVINLAISNGIKKYSGAISLLADENGDIDIGTLHKEYAEIINKAGVLNMSGLKLNTQDLDSLFETIKAEVPPTTK